VRYRIAALAGTGVLALAVLFAAEGVAQVKKGKSRPLTTKQMMGGHIGPTCTALGKELQAGPADDKAWEAAATKAALLNESGYTLMDDGRCPDAVWAEACKKLQDSSHALLAKVEAKDMSGAREAFTTLTASCKSCHTAHKK
jgi:cytochrome c556